MLYFFNLFEWIPKIIFAFTSPHIYVLSQVGLVNLGFQKRNWLFISFRKLIDYTGSLPILFSLSWRIKRYTAGPFLER
jgi:hypothetical protein